MVKMYRLDLNTSVSGIAGFPLGKQVFEHQVKSQLSDEDYKEGIVIVFPPNIKRVTSSFSQGFFGDLIEKYGYYSVKKSVEVKASSKELSESILDVLE